MSFRLYFWFLFIALLFVPAMKSFFVNVSTFIKSCLCYCQYKASMNELLTENNTLKNQVKYYKTPSGYKALIKERLEKLEEGEILIKYKD